MRWTRAAVLAAALVTAACSGAARPAPEAPQPGTLSHAEIEALYRARMDSARMRFTEADVRFMTGMITHHAQALVMAEMAATHTTTPAIRTLAARIINAQKDEIERMQQWLRDRGQPVPEVHVEGTTMTVRYPGHAGHGGHAGHDAHAHMPGMLTDEQIRELDAARGGEFDRLFLTYMIQHHRGAVTMVHELFATDGALQDEDVFRLASDVQVDQITEIARMEQMLAALGAQGGAP